ncbi:branched-chain amino acid transport system substrate-binding protein [Pseudacidovorax sp. 1753]|uniref:ABC transporter substrate-binding protein n=1 Tax=Pseudacidovorax sp. 1753 TaxID=3156419 RepID=UPI00339119A2
MLLSLCEEVRMIRRLLLGAMAALAFHGAVRAADTIKVGVMLVDSGPLAFIQPLYTEPAKLAVEMINAQGGVLGRKFELVTRSHSGTPAGAIATATKLVQQDGTAFLTGFNTSAAVLALGPKLGALDALLIDATTSSDDQTGKNCQANYFRTTVNDSMAVNVLRPAVAKSGGKTWNLIVPDYAFGHSFAKRFKALVEEQGGTLQTLVFAPTATADFGSMISQLAAKPADGLGVVVLGNDAISFAKQQQQFGLFAKFKTVVALQFTNEVVLGAQGDSTVGTYVAQSYLASMPGERNAAFVKAFEARFKRPPYYIEADQYQVYELLRAAIEKAQSTDVAAVRAALASLKANTILGSVEMRASDHQLSRPMVLAQIVRGADGQAVPALRAVEPASVVMPPPSPECKL